MLTMQVIYHRWYVTDIIHMIKHTRPFLSVFTYCKQWTVGRPGNKAVPARPILSVRHTLCRGLLRFFFTTKCAVSSPLSTSSSLMATSVDRGGGGEGSPIERTHFTHTFIVSKASSSFFRCFFSIGDSSLPLST